MSNEYSSKCFVGATKHVAELGKPVQIMIRLPNHGKPEGDGLGDGQMSGWLFMSADEEQSDEPGMYWLGQIIERDPAIIPYLSTPAPCRLERDDTHPIFHKAKSPTILEMVWTVVRHFGWHWASLVQHDHNNFKAIAVVNQDRSLALFPFHDVFGCLENHVYPPFLLAFNMLQAGKIPQQPTGEFVNLMDGVRHIVPPG